ncbi:hypothetical protein K1719_001444 [Acacia pycnantha]|nr:hypothetical protein K1719_001444 [Acacia pycnantha]
METRCTPQMAQVRAQNLRFSNMEIMDCGGYSGGIWCVWDGSIVVVSLLERHHQFLHFQITSSTDLQLSLWKEVKDFLLQESLLWAQKAIAEWSVYGDRNSRFFHARANQRRKSKKIEAIKDEEGTWVYDIAKIKGTPAP